MDLQVSINSTYQQFQRFMQENLRLLNCENQQHRYQFSDVCVDNRCKQKKSYFHPICNSCKKENSHIEEQLNHQTIAIVDFIQQLIDLSFMKNQQQAKENLEQDSTKQLYEQILQEQKTATKELLSKTKKIEKQIQDLNNDLETQLLQTQTETEQKQTKIKEIIVQILNQENSQQYSKYFIEVSTYVEVNDKLKLQFRDNVTQSISYQIENYQNHLQKIGQSLGNLATSIGYQAPLLQNKVKPSPDDDFFKALAFLRYNSPILPEHKLDIIEIEKELQQEKVCIIDYLKDLNISNTDDAIKLLKNYVGNKKQNKDQLYQAYAYYLLGHCYAFDYGSQEDQKEGFKYFQLSANLYNAHGQCDLGVCYGSGIGTQINLKQAQKFFELSAQQNNSFAFINLGNIYFLGRGVQKDYSKALQYYIQSANLGNFFALQNIGCMYFKGLGVKKNDETAYNYIKQSAQLGYSVGLHDLGFFYEKGVGVQQNLQLASRYYKMAMNLGNKNAAESYKRLVGGSNQKTCFEDFLYELFIK